MIADAPPVGISDRFIRRYDPSGPTREGAPVSLSNRDLKGMGGLATELAWLAKNVYEPRDTIRRRLRTFVERPMGWDSYGGRPLDADVAKVAERFLLELASTSLPSPYLVPTSLGGLAVEWHSGDREFTVELRPTSLGSVPETYVFFSDGVGGEEWEELVADIDADRLNGAFERVVSTP